MSNTDPLIIGPFQIQYLLGRTPSHLVYLARDPHHKRPVTLTTALHGMDPRKTAEQFQREWEISRRLTHPGIQKVLDRGSHPEFGPFLVKEYLKGVNLAVLLEDRLPPQATLHLLVQLTHALQAAAQAGVVHGDIKPENILVDFEGHLTLLDFHAGSWERTGPVLGSPGFVAPEVLNGERPSSRSDLFSFAVTAFLMWTGTMPFGGGDAESMMQATRDKDPNFPANMPVSMRMTFQSALEKDPSARTQELRAFMAGLITTANLPEPLTSEIQALLGGKQVGIRGLAPFLAKHVQVKGPQPEASPCATRPLGRERSQRITPLRAALAGSALLIVGLAVWRLLPRPVAPQPPAQAATPVVVPAVIPSQAPPRSIRVLTEPSGADLFLDGQPAGRSPQENLNIEKAHLLLVHREGFVDRTIELGANPSIPDPIRLDPSPTPIAAPAPAKKLAPPQKPVPKAPNKKEEFNLYEQLRKQEGR